MPRDLAKASASAKARDAFARSVRCARKDVHGVAAVEFSIVAPLLILMMVCIADLALGIFRMLQVQNAAHAGTQYAFLHPDFNKDAIVAAVKNATSFADLKVEPEPEQFYGCPSTSAVVKVEGPSAACADGSTPGLYVKVSTAGEYEPMFSYPGLKDIFPLKLQAQSTVRVQ
jgi:Flp pilus assembly protein TadG